MGAVVVCGAMQASISRGWQSHASALEMWCAAGAQCAVGPVRIWPDLLGWLYLVWSPWCKAQTLCPPSYALPRLYKPNKRSKAMTVGTGSRLVWLVWSSCMSLCKVVLEACVGPPLQLPGSAWDASIPGEGFRYGYIIPGYSTVAPIIKEMCPHCIVPDIPRSGPAPVLMRFADLWKAAPDWEKYTAWIEGHAHARKAMGACGERGSEVGRKTNEWGRLHGVARGPCTTINGAECPQRGHSVVERCAAGSSCVRLAAAVASPDTCHCQLGCALLFCIP